MAQKLNVVVVAEKPLEPHAEMELEQVAYIGFDADAAGRIYKAFAKQGATAYLYRRLPYDKKKRVPTAAENKNREERKRQQAEEGRKRLLAEARGYEEQAKAAQAKADEITGTKPAQPEPKRDKPRGRQ